MQLETENGLTRWDELKQVISIVIELGALLDDDGIDIIFLNRGSRRRVRSVHEIQDLLRNPPQYRTPLSSKTREAMRLANPQKPQLLLIATDGEPCTVDNQRDPNYDDVNVFMNVLVNERDPNRTFIGILKCTNNERETGYLDMLDKDVRNLDVLDDFYSELAQVRSKQGRHFNYTPGDHVARFLLGPVYDKYDKMDEKFVE
jgi:hypothetical protein